MHVDGGRTDFNQYSLQQMVAMLNAADSASIRATADSWHAVGQHLNGQANALQDMLPDFESKWQGGAATQYESMLTSLYTGVRQLANHANTMRDVLYDSADALDDAKAKMPAAVAIPDVSPSTVAMATTPLQMMSPADPQEAAVLAARQQDAVAQVQAQQAAVAQAQAAHSQAAQIMTELATRYSTNTASIPDSPAGADAAARYGSHSIGDTTYSGSLGTGPGTGTGTPIDYSGNPFPGDPVTGIAEDGSVTTVTDSPLFGGMIAAGLAAATAASAGRFGAVPTIPAFAQGDSNGKPKHPAGGAAAVGAGAAAAGVIRGFGGPGPGPGGPGLAAASPTGFGQLVGGGGAPTAGLGGLPAAAGTGSSGAAGMPMGAMPMGAGMGGGDGSGRRTPQWLVETEDVWGESSTVSPAVLGED